jgi:AcrR family transcriptional regulator
MSDDSALRNRSRAGGPPNLRGIGDLHVIPRSVGADVVRLTHPTEDPLRWSDDTAAFSLIDEEAAGYLTRRLRDGRVRRAVVAVLARALDERGYGGVTYPCLARLAGVTTEDVERVFPAKADLVLAALGRGAWSQPPLGRPGGEIVASYLAFWENGDNTAILRELLRASISDRRLAVALERHVIGTVIRPFAEEDQSTDAYPRARLAFAALLGLAVSRYVLRQEPLACADHETLAAWMGPSIDHFLHGKLGGAMTGMEEAEHDTQVDRGAPVVDRVVRAVPAARVRPV